MEEVMGIGSAVQTLVQGGGILPTAASYFGDSPAKKAYKLQRKMLQHQIPDMVKGAVSVGIHPLAALGVNPASSGVSASIGDASGSLGDAGSFLSAMGSGISEYMSKTETPEASAANDLLFKKAELENDLIAAQIQSEKARVAQMLSPGSGDQGPIDLQTPVGLFRFPNRNAANIAEQAGGEGANWFFGALNTADGAVQTVFGNPEENVAREIRQIVGADIWTQARADLAKAWARTMADIHTMYEPGGFRKVFDY